MKDKLYYALIGTLFFTVCLIAGNIGSNLYDHSKVRNELPKQEENLVTQVQLKKVQDDANYFILNLYDRMDKLEKKCKEKR